MLLTLVLALAASPPAPALAYDPQTEASNYSKSNERAQYDFDRPERFRATNVDRASGFVESAGIALKDPSRHPITTCAPRYNACAGDTRTYDWGGKIGLSIPVLWTNRHGAHISGTVWSAFPPSGVAPARGPLIVITTGSAQAPETIYWTQAQALAKRGYVVLTWESQGQGRSDTFGTSLGGMPSEDYANFRDGTTEALDFALSARNPLRELVDPTRVGLAGHSYGAVAVSEVASRDPRVDAVVAWDWLTADVCDLYESGTQDFCPDRPRRPIAPRVPGLNISNDYDFSGSPTTGDPDPDARGRAFAPFVARGVDVMSVVIRGGTHYECPYIPNEALGATLRGIDLCGWYTLAWFDKYLRGDPTADPRLLSDRWRHDPLGAQVDPNHDPNALSFYYRSRVAIHRADGSAYRCDDLRAGCPGQIPQAADCYPGPFSIDVERVRGPLSTCHTEAAGPGPRLRLRSARACLPGRSLRVRLPAGARDARLRIAGHGSRTLRHRTTDVRLPRSRRWRVTLTATLAGGRTARATRAYRACR